MDVVDDSLRHHPWHNEQAYQEDVAKWVNKTMAEMQGDCGLVGNAWLKTGFEWFAKNN